MKFLFYAIALLGLSFAPSLVLAANDVTVESGASITLSDTGLSYTIGTDTTAPSFTVNTGNVNLTVDASSIFDLTSSNRSDYTFALPDGCGAETTCTDSQSTLTITCASTLPSQKTFTITPGAANTCVSGSSGGGAVIGGGGGGSTGSTTAPTTGVSAEPSFYSDTPLSVALGSRTYIVSLSNLSEDAATVNIQPYGLKVIKMTIGKDTPVKVDIDGNGDNDTLLTYEGLDSDGRGMLKMEELTDVPQATCPLTVKNAYKHADSSAVYYITDRCTKRPFAKSDVFFTYFDSWDKAILTTKTKLDSVPSDILGFMPYGPKYDPQYGALVKSVFDPKTYLLLGTERYWITSESVFTSLNYVWNWVEDASQDLLDMYSIGSEIGYTDHHPNYTIVKYADSAEVYRLEPDPTDSAKQVKRHIVDEDAYNRLRFRWDRIVTIDDTEVYTDGEPLE